MFERKSWVTIELREIWDIDNPDGYKIHFARWNKLEQPLEVWARSPEEWLRWQEYWPGRNDFNRPYIFPLMQFYHETDAWLFGGVFRVVQRLSNAYRVELMNEKESLIGRLKLKTPYRGRNTRPKLEEQYDDLEVIEVLRERYTGTPFPGYASINLSFEELETIVNNERPDWSAALENIVGIYAISDTRVEKIYVGAAFGDGGIWSRWVEYVSSGHGGNEELRRVVGDQGVAYCRSHFRFTLLEALLKTTRDETVAAREAHSKQVLLSRGRRGFNRN